MESQTIFPSQTTAPATKRNDIAIKWGVIIGLVSCVLTTVNFMFILRSSYVAFLVVTFLGFFLTLILSGMGAAEQRRAQGGYMTFKEAFRVIFIAVLIAAIISGIYGVLYVKFIDPGSVDRMKEATLGLMESMGAPQESIDKASDDFDKNNADSMNIGRIVLGMAQSLIGYSLFGLLVALIVRRKRPEGLPG